MPLQYYKPDAPLPPSETGHDLLKAIPPIGVRPKIGGRQRRYTKKSHKTRGGFIPSVMEGFVSAASKYIVPIALYAGYKIMSKKKSRQSRRK
jgi:hypothetical protein